MSASLLSLAECELHVLITGPHALVAHGVGHEVEGEDCECAIAAENEEAVTGHFARSDWNVVYRTPFFAKFRLLSTGTPVIKVLFFDPTTFGQLYEGSIEHMFGPFTLRVPSLMHVIAMKLQSMKNEREREAEDLAAIVALLRANPGRWNPQEVDAACRRFGPPGIYARLAHQLIA